jgi:hypothetical protein
MGKNTLLPGDDQRFVMFEQVAPASLTGTQLAAGIGDGTVIFGKPLADGGLALVALLRVAGRPGAPENNVECGPACWAQTHFENGTVLAVTDLWASHTTELRPWELLANATVTVPAPLTLTLGREKGSSRLFKLIKK